MQSDLNTIRSEYEQLSNTCKELKKHNYQMMNSNQIINLSGSASINPNNLNVSMDNTGNYIKSPNKSNSGNTSLNNLNQENENLEEDMRKAKESADMLRSVVLPLETEINTLKTRSNTSDKRIQELEKLVDEVSFRRLFSQINYYFYYNCYINW